MSRRPSGMRVSNRHGHQHTKHHMNHCFDFVSAEMQNLHTSRLAEDRWCRDSFGLRNWNEGVRFRNRGSIFSSSMWTSSFGYLLLIRRVYSCYNDPMLSHLACIGGLTFQCFELATGNRRIRKAERRKSRMLLESMIQPPKSEYYRESGNI